MNKLLPLLLLAASSAQAAPIALECGLIETPTSTHDSWGLTFYGNHVAFFDNDHYSYAEIIETDEEMITYKSITPNDPFKVVLANPNQEWASEPYYAELFLGRKSRPQIFECRKVDPKEAKQVFEDMAEDLERAAR